MSLTPNKGYTIPSVGGDFDTWGDELNGNFQTIDLNIGGVESVNVAGNSNITINATQSENMVQSLTGILTGDINYVLPNAGAFYVVDNETTGSHSITVKAAGGGSGVVVPQGVDMLVWTDGTKVSSATSAYLLNGGTVTGGSLVITGPGTIASMNVTGALTASTGTVATQVITMSLTSSGPSVLSNNVALAGSSGDPITTTQPGWFVGTNGAASGYGPSATPLSLGIGGAGNLVNFFFSGANQVGSIGTNGSSVAYNTTSDRRLKIDRGSIDAAESGRMIDAMLPHWYQWREGGDHTMRLGFFAQELGGDCPWAVTPGSGNPGEDGFVPWQVSEGSLVALLTAELKSLRTRMARLENGFT